MTTPIPRLNRIFRVSGSSTRTERLPIRYGANDRRLPPYVVPISQGQWVATTFSSSVGAGVTTAQQFADLGIEGFTIENPTVNPDGTIQGGVTPLNALLSIADQGHWMRVATPDSGESYVEFDVTFIRTFDDESQITVENGRLVGDDFALAPETYTQFLFERHSSDQSVTTTTDLPVWGELTERGSVLGVISITSEDDPVTTGAQEEAGAVVRYDDRLAIGMLLTDDLARVWGIRGSRTLGDRRYLEFDLSRTVDG